MNKNSEKERKIINKLWTFTFCIKKVLIFWFLCVIIYTTDKYYCLVRFLIVRMIQHFLPGNSAPAVDCRPPAPADEGSVKQSGVYPPASCGFYSLYVPARRFYFKNTSSGFSWAVFSMQKSIILFIFTFIWCLHNHK